MDNGGLINFQIDSWTDNLSNLHYYSFLELSIQFEILKKECEILFENFIYPLEEEKVLKMEKGSILLWIWWRKVWSIKGRRKSDWIEARKGFKLPRKMKANKDTAKMVLKILMRTLKILDDKNLYWELLLCRKSPTSQNCE